MDKDRLILSTDHLLILSEKKSLDFKGCYRKITRSRLYPFRTPKAYQRKSINPYAIFLNRRA